MKDESGERIEAPWYRNKIDTAFGVVQGEGNFVQIQAPHASSPPHVGIFGGIVRGFLRRMSRPRLDFVSIGIAEDLCLWEEEEDGVDKLGCKYGFHQLATLKCDEEQKLADQRISDPVLDVTLLNPSGKPLILSALGFHAVTCWSKLKGLPIAGKVRCTDVYNLQVKHFTPGRSRLLKIADPIYMNSGDVYRFRLRLRGYRQALPGNQSIIQVAIETHERPFFSEPVYLGVY